MVLQRTATAGSISVKKNVQGTISTGSFESGLGGGGSESITLSFENVRVAYPEQAG